MIVLNLQCDASHPFEGWFASSDAFASQQERGLVECPVCGSTLIHRTPSAPYVARGKPSPAQPPHDPRAMVAQFVSHLREAASKAEDVGASFAQEARKIHYGDAPDRSIRGQASGDEIGELIDEGINVLPVLPDKEDLH